MIRLLFLLIIFCGTALTIFGQSGRDTIIPTGLYFEKGSDWNILLDDIGDTPDDTINIGSKNILIYFIPCRFIFVDDNNIPVNEPAKLVLVESKNSFRIADLPEIFEVCSELLMGRKITKKQINGSGLEEVIIDLGFSICGASGVVCAHFGGIYIIDIENEECLLNILIYHGEENNAGRYGGENTAFTCQKTVQTSDKKIIISKWNCGEMDKPSIEDEFEEIIKESPSGTFEWVHDKFIKKNVE